MILLAFQIVNQKRRTARYSQDVAIQETTQPVKFWLSEIDRLEKVKKLTGYGEAITSIGSLHWINKNILLYCGERTQLNE